MHVKKPSCSATFELKGDFLRDSLFELLHHQYLLATVDILCITAVLLSDTISLRLPRETAKKLREIARKEGKDRSKLIREILENGVKDKSVEHAVELYRTGEASGWKAAQLAGVSLWRFYRILGEKGVLIQYSEQDLEEDLKS